MHTHANQVIVNRFTSDVTPIDFRILIVVSLEVIGGVFASANISRCGVATQYKRTPL
jgi:hypothetical protein